MENMRNPDPGRPRAACAEGCSGFPSSKEILGEHLGGDLCPQVGLDTSSPGSGLSGAGKQVWKSPRPEAVLVGDSNSFWNRVQTSPRAPLTANRNPATSQEKILWSFKPQSRGDR